MVNGAEANIPVLSFSIFTYRCGSMFQLQKVQSAAVITVNCVSHMSV